MRYRDIGGESDAPICRRSRTIQFAPILALLRRPCGWDTFGSPVDLPFPFSCRWQRHWRNSCSGGDQGERGTLNGAGLSNPAAGTIPYSVHAANAASRCPQVPVGWFRAGAIVKWLSRGCSGNHRSWDTANCHRFPGSSLANPSWVFILFPRITLLGKTWSIRSLVLSDLRKLASGLENFLHRAVWVFPDKRCSQRRLAEPARAYDRFNGLIDLLSSRW